MASIAIVISVIKISLSVNHDFLAKNRADNHVSLIERNIIFVLLYS
ncbi:pilus assembly protein, partial [Pseudoalteromonas sp. S2893]